MISKCLTHAVMLLPSCLKHEFVSPLSKTVKPFHLGPDNDANEAKKFVESEFRARVLQRNRIIYPHFTTATDTSNIRVVIDVVVTQIIRDHMKDASLL